MGFRGSRVRIPASRPHRRFARSAGSTPHGVIPLRRFAPAARASSPLGDFARRELYGARGSRDLWVATRIVVGRSRPSPPLVILRSAATKDLLPFPVSRFPFSVSRLVGH